MQAQTTRSAVEEAVYLNALSILEKFTPMVEINENDPRPCVVAVSMSAL
jgi:hypothetical protein